MSMCIVREVVTGVDHAEYKLAKSEKDVHFNNEGVHGLSNQLFSRDTVAKKT